MQIFKCCCAILVYPLYIVVCKRKDNKFFFSYKTMQKSWKYLFMRNVFY